MVSLERLTEEQKDKECFWWEKPREGMTREEDPAHITERVFTDESPSGNECETSVAYCGEEMLGYTIGSGINSVYGNIKEAINENLPICKKCSEFYLQKLGVLTNDSLPGDDESYCGSKVYTCGMIRRGEEPSSNFDSYGNAQGD